MYILEILINLLILVQMAMSPVFQKMFEANMRESETHSVSITDFPSVVVEEFVQYLYHLESESDAFMQKYAVEAWALADKYQVECYKEYITRKCASFVSADNVVDLVKRAEKYNATYIKMYCIKYFSKNVKEIGKKRSRGFETLPPNTLVEIVNSFFDK